MKQYIIVTADTTPLLEEKVNEEIGRGFRPHGGALQYHSGLAQPMMRPEKKEFGSSSAAVFHTRGDNAPVRKDLADTKPEAVLRKRKGV